ncbi:MAG: RNA polymerase sigma factor [Lachnospiraceae bacterium]|nr:RNA polymerase sigma factor [Lachnospiraceae bacterium]
MEEKRDFVQRARKGDKEAFGALYEDIYADLFRFALYTLKNRQDAEDVVSDTVISAYQQIGNLRDADAFKGWIFRILSNQCKRRLKEYLDKTVVLPDDLAADSLDMAEDSHVRQVFAKLSDEERFIISMHLFAGYNSREIGKILHMNDNTVRSKESRALKKMEQFLAE